MIPVNQTRFEGAAGGNCLAACLASILELPLDEVDTPALFDKATMWQAIMRITLPRGLRPFSYHVGGGDSPAIAPPGFHIACSASHATVALDGKIVHDPHPRRLGLDGITEWILLLPIARADVAMTREQRMEIARSFCKQFLPPTGELTAAIPLSDDDPMVENARIMLDLLAELEGFWHPATEIR